jgi:hypothetical protein
MLFAAEQRTNHAPDEFFRFDPDRPLGWLLLRSASQPLSKTSVSRVRYLGLSFASSDEVIA